MNFKKINQNLIFLNSKEIENLLIQHYDFFTSDQLTSHN